MNKTIGLQLVVYSLMLAGLSYLAHQLAPTVARPTLVAGLVGGAVCLLGGFRAIAGSRSRALPILTLVPICFVMLSQTVMHWGGGKELPGQNGVTAVNAVLLALSMGMLLRIAYAGVVFDKPPGNLGQDREAKSPGTGSRATPANAPKRT